MRTRSLAAPGQTAQDRRPSSAGIHAAGSLGYVPCRYRGASCFTYALSPKGLYLAAKRRRPRSGRSGKPPRKRTSLKLRRLPQTVHWELVHPRCVRDRADDMEEVRAMVAADEIEIATEELRYLLDGCSDFVEAHCLLGELALADEDLKLARAHFGYAYDVAARALPRGPLRGTLPYELVPNRYFFDAAKGLVACLHRIGRDDQAIEVARKMLTLDPDNPLGLEDAIDLITSESDDDASKDRESDDGASDDGENTPTD